MIIKPIETLSEFQSYGSVRHKHATNRFKASIQTNIAKAKRKYEFDSYDLKSFHFGAFNEGRLNACTRIVNDTKGIQELAHVSSNGIIYSLVDTIQPVNSLSLQEYITGAKYDKVDHFFNLLRTDGKKFSEIGRLIRNIKKGEKRLMNYMICYAWAFFRFYQIDYCFFDAIKSHCNYYEKVFHCRHVMQDIEFNPITEGEPSFLMQATTSDLPEKMNGIVNRTFESFNQYGGPCSVKLNEIK